MLVNLLDILKIAVWPLVLMSALFFFRKVFTYMFFSVDEFSLFGIKGTLKNVYAVIEEKAQEKYDRRLREEESKKEIEKMSNELKKVQGSKKSFELKYEDMLAIAENQSKKITELEGVVTDLKTKAEKVRDMTQTETIEWMFENYHIKKKEKGEKLKEITEEKDTLTQ